ncbi:MAG: Na+/H+ antiporter subunit E [Caldilineaceae bacterium]
MFLLNLLLALAWLVLTGQFTPVNFLFGLLFSFGLLWLFARFVTAEGHSGQALRYVHKVWQVVELVLFFLKELVQANLRVALTVLRRHPQMAPAIVGVPLDLQTPEAMTLLASLITLTPGTISVDVLPAGAAEQRMLYVHVMHAGRTPEQLANLRRTIKNDYERRVREVLA